MIDWEAYFKDIADKMKTLTGFDVAEDSQLKESLRHQTSLKDYILIFDEGPSRFPGVFADNRTDLTSINLRIVKQCKDGDYAGKNTAQREAKTMLFQILGKLTNDFQNRELPKFSVFELGSVQTEPVYHYPERHAHGSRMSLELGQSVNNETYFNEVFFDL